MQHSHTVQSNRPLRLLALTAISIKVNFRIAKGPGIRNPQSSFGEDGSFLAAHHVPAHLIAEMARDVSGISPINTLYRVVCVEVLNTHKDL